MTWNYQKADETLKSARNQNNGKPVANNTRLFRRGDDIAVQLHQTDVVTYHRDGSVTLDSGGWQTVTTKARINEFSGLRGVGSCRGVWYLYVGDKQYLFQDGLRVCPNGTVKNGVGKRVKPYDPAASKGNARVLKLRKRVADYAKAFVDKLYAGKIPAPSAGDCFYCSMQVVDGQPDAGKTLGEASRDQEHIKCHLKEKYFVPSLLYRAAETFGASMAERHVIHTLTHGGSASESWPGAESRKGWMAKSIEKHVRRYVLRQLGLAA